MSRIDVIYKNVDFLEKNLHSVKKYNLMESF